MKVSAIVLAFGGLVWPLAALAAYNDYGPLEDVMALRKTAANLNGQPAPQYDYCRVVAIDDYGVVDICTKGVGHIYFHRSAGMWQRLKCDPRNSACVPKAIFAALTSH